MAAAEVTASHKDRIVIKHQKEEIVVPIPEGYEKTNFRRLQLDSLPMVQERQILAAFVPKITAHNEYSVTPEPGHTRPSYYLVYRPKLDFNPRQVDDLLARLADQYYKKAFDEVSEEQRFALQRLDESTLSVTWVNAAAFSLNADAQEAAAPSVNCINTTAYQKGKAVLMFDTLEACGLNASAIKNHSQDWLKRIKSANEPLSYGQQLLKEKAIPPREGESEEGAQSEAENTEEAQDTAHNPNAFLWFLAGVLAVFLTVAFVQRWRASR
ncbi:MAG: hypothetical protein R3352_10180 [Salinisphaeraceae bacterium]|nr:hypothetical protein [Salinisphaeraceae bacterium]